MIIAYYLTRIPKKKGNRKAARKNNNRQGGNKANSRNQSLDIREHVAHERSGSVEDDEYSQTGYTQTEEGLGMDDDNESRQEDSFGSFNPNLNKA